MQFMQTLPIFVNHQHLSDIQFTFYYTYALGMREVINELELVSWLVKLIVGENTFVKCIFDERPVDPLEIRVDDDDGLVDDGGEVDANAGYSANARRGRTIHVEMDKII